MDDGYDNLPFARLVDPPACHVRGHHWGERWFDMASKTDRYRCTVCGAGAALQSTWIDERDPLRALSAQVPRDGWLDQVSRESSIGS